MPQPRRATTPCRHTVSGLFHSPDRGSFHLSLVVLVRYRSSPSIQPWGMGPPDSDGVSRVPSYLGSHWGRSRFRVRGFHPVSPAFPGRSPTERRSHVVVPQPRGASPPVWATARSLATTCAIIVIFFSSGYLDVSVPRVRPPEQLRCGGIAPAGFPHSDIRGSQGICPSPRLFAACHVLRRLREPQASPMRPFLLSLYPSNGTRLKLPPPRLLDHIFFFARFVSQLDFSLRFASRTRNARKARRRKSFLFAFPTCQ